MEDKRNISASPLATIDTSFAHYVAARKAKEQQHMVDGIPDYTFELDYELRHKLSGIPYFEKICRNITSTCVAQEIEALNRVALAVGPDQFPEIYRMGVDCAHRLGIGIPNIFVLNNVDMNAYTIAADDTSPIVVVYSGIVERMTPGELKCVIAHECGHIHNNHSVYRSVINALRNGFSGGNFLLSGASKLLMNSWSRACEVSADRAALICADNLEDAFRVNEKLLYGATLNTNFRVNVEALRKQLDGVLNNPAKVLELTTDHPTGVRRIFLDEEFSQCEVLYDWRPEFRHPDTVARSKRETDERCKRIVNILDNSERS